MNNFTKEWLTSTLAPDSIRNIKTTEKQYLDLIKNEDNTIHIMVVSNDEKVLAIGESFDSILKSKQYTYIEAIKEVARLLNITNISITKS